MVEKRKLMSLFGVIAIVIVFSFAAQGMITGNSSLAGSSSNTQQNIASSTTGTTAQTGSVQVVKMTIKNGNYILDPARVVVNTPVRIEADMNSIRGCYTTVVISELGIRKSLSASNNVIEFTPTKAGTFYMTCGMGMAGGQIIVTDASGNAPVATTLPPASTGGSCGSGGGCGCGG